MAIKSTQKSYKNHFTPKLTVGRDWTHIGIQKSVKRKIALLAKVRDGKIHRIVQEWTEKAWEEAKVEGLVTDAMVGEL
jgi:hypothetical protein